MQMINFREAQTSEAAVLSSIALQAKAHWGYPAEWLQLWASELTISPEQIAHQNVLVAEISGELAGFTAVSIHKKQAELEHMWVLPAFMRRGIGRSLVERALGQARDNGCESLRVVSDPGAVPFYQAMGGRVVGEQSSVPAPRALPVVEFNLYAS
ncbi:GNAT family N-acetyltransferase [Modicisalibacter muralis]|uniref:GNAT family N-acetyltransferase n=1 Tax=Modicisalibacter muralis TaxID=119000 RepID=UPI000B8005B9|nr:GNAT family N-acetyltransferase [Halomonas muralis]